VRIGADTGHRQSSVLQKPLSAENPALKMFFIYGKMEEIYNDPEQSGWRL
jgi:hypothetical protein